MTLFSTSTEPHYFKLEHWQHIPSVIIDLLTSIALTHQVVRSESSRCSFQTLSTDHRKHNTPIKRQHLASFQNPSVKKIYKHYQSTLNALSTDLKSGAEKQSSMVVSSMIGLAWLEVNSPA